MKSLQPAIKWSGSKRPIAKDIVDKFPKKINTYSEPFCGGCSVMFYLLNNSDYEVEKYVCSDINAALIDLWNEIKRNHNAVVDSYTAMWNELQPLSIEQRKEYFYSVRERFNKQQSPYDFMFIMRTTTNGMPRYNLSGEFNNSFHVTRSGIKPKEFGNVINEWSILLNRHDVVFKCQNYSEIKTKSGDVLYLDPPYGGTKGMYYGTIDYFKLWDWIKNQDCFVALSFNGKSTNQEYINLVPDGIFDESDLIYSGNSSFRRVIGTSNKEYVHESLYIKQDKKCKHIN